MAATAEKPADTKKAADVPGGVMTLSRYMLDQARKNTDYQVWPWGQWWGLRFDVGCMCVVWTRERRAYCCCVCLERGSPEQAFRSAGQPVSPSAMILPLRRYQRSSAPGFLA